MLLKKNKQLLIGIYLKLVICCNKLDVKFLGHE